MSDIAICIISTPDSFKIKAVKTSDMDNYHIAAIHPTLASAQDGLKRAQELEKKMRPMWQAAIEHERRLRNTMLDAVYAAAKPEDETKGTTNGL